MISVSVQSKQCNKCGEVKLLGEFHKRKDTRDGCQTHCKVCRNEHHKVYSEKVKDHRSVQTRANSEKKKEYDAKYREANYEKIKAYRAANLEKIKNCVAKWRTANPEKIREYSAKYHLDNQDKARERNANYRAANPEKIKDYQVEYRAANPEKIKIQRAKYCKANLEKFRVTNSIKRAAKLKAIPKWLTKEDYQAIKNIYKEAVRLTQETGIRYHVDHIHPLRGKYVCGLHCFANLQILTEAENCAKLNKFKPYVESETHRSKA